MSYTVTKFVLELKGLTPSEKAVAHSLAYHAHADGADAYPSMSTIAAEAGLKNRRNAQRIVRRLEAKGIIAAVSPKSGGRYKSTHYRFNLENSVPDCLSGEVPGQTASVQVGNCVPTGQKERLYGRTKGYERLEKEGSGSKTSALLKEEDFKDYRIRQPEESDDDYWFRQCVEEALDEEEEMIRSIPPELARWVSGLHHSPVALTEADASKAFAEVNNILFNGAAKLFGVERGAFSTLLSYARVWRLDESYGSGVSAALAEKIISCRVANDDDPHPVTHRSLIWNYFVDQLRDPRQTNPVRATSDVEQHGEPISF